MSYQKFIAVGNLGTDPEERYTPAGTAVTNFNLAVNKKYKDQSGEYQEKTNWFSVAVYGKQAESCAKYLSKGSLVLVEGEVEDAYAYIPKEGDGKPQAINKVTAQRVRFLSTNKGNDDGYTDGFA